MTNQIKSATIKIDKNPRETGKIYLRKGKTERVAFVNKKLSHLANKKVSQL